MITDRSEFRVHIRRVFFIMIRTFYRWICSHPYLLGCVGFVYLLYRTCPLLFSPLLAASPVLVCTFVLLGTILSFGEPNNIPEIETEPETTTVHDAALFTTEASKDSTVVERGDKSFTVERFVSTEKDENDDRPLADEIKRDTQVGFEERAFVFDLEKKGGDGEEEKFIGNDGKHAEQSRESGGSLDEMMKDSKEDQVDVSPVSPWRPMKHEEDENDDDADHDDSLDTSSDGAESSSPDPSMTDIIPMLDELHPLLHSENPRRGIADLEGSDATSEEPDMSSSSDSDEGTESDANSESHEEEGDNKNLEEEEKKEEKEDESKSPIKWTEADEKTVMDLGSLELERNQRLESLIAMRRARNNMRMMAERRLESLIAMRSADVSFKIPPVSTTRRNPFDFPYDDMGLPPIPGSSPSIMFARRNPFDLPYEPNEEKPGLKGDGFEEEFSSQQPKETVFRRHESVRVGPSMLGGLRHDVAEIVLGSAETHVTHHEHDADHQEEGPLSVSSQEYLEELYEEVKEAVDTPVVRLVSPSEDAVVVSTGMVEQLLPVEHTSSTLGYGDTTEHLSALEESPDVVHDIAETPVNRSVAEGIVQEEDKQKDEASVRSVEDIEDEEELMLEDSKDIDPEPVIPEYPVPMDGDVSKATLVDGNHRARMKETESGTIPSWWRNVEPKKKSTPVKKKVIGSSSSVGLAFKEKPWARGRVCPKIKVRER